jgi:hypothetical protein
MNNDGKFYVSATFKHKWLKKPVTGYIGKLDESGYHLVKNIQDCILFDSKQKAKKVCDGGYGCDAILEKTYPKEIISKYATRREFLLDNDIEFCSEVSINQIMFSEGKGIISDEI